LFINDRNKDSLNLIRNPNSFDRYFSYHIIGKTPEHLVREILNQSQNGDREILNSNLVELLKREDGFYKLQELIEIVKDKHKERNYLYMVVLQNLYLIPDSERDIYGKDNRIIIIELIAKILNQTNDNSKVELEIAKQLNIDELCYFTRKFKEENPIKIQLEKEIVNKAKSDFNSRNPVFAHPSNTSKMIMYYWNLHDKENFENHLKKSIIDIEMVKKFIRNFPGFWNNSFYGGLTRENYNSLKKYIDENLLYSKITALEPALDNLEFPADYIVDDTEESTEEDNLMQFIYWYKKDKES
jgi:uncharacterized protein YcgL (UPF0745 family)